MQFFCIFSRISAKMASSNAPCLHIFFWKGLVNILFLVTIMISVQGNASYLYQIFWIKFGSDHLLILEFAVKFIYLSWTKSTNIFTFFFFPISVFFHNHSRITRLKGKGEGISLTPRYQFQPLQRQLDISRRAHLCTW